MIMNDKGVVIRITSTESGVYTLLASFNRFPLLINHRGTKQATYCLYDSQAVSLNVVITAGVRLARYTQTIFSLANTFVTI
jgi:hypothetical protein